MRAPAPAVLWFRRDLRLRDNPALASAARAAGEAGVLALFVVDPVLWDAAGPSRRVYLTASLRALDESLGSRLTIRTGDPAVEVPAAARDVGAGSVHLAADYGPYGARRDRHVERVLAERGVELRRVGSAYAVPPGSVATGGGTGYSTFGPFSRAWQAHGWQAPADDAVPGPRWLPAAGQPWPRAAPLPGMALPQAGEAAALRRWLDFRDFRLSRYADTRNRPDLDGTSLMSVHLKWGEIHPRTLLAGLDPASGRGAATYLRELAWREFYADVLWRRPDSAREHLRPQLGRLAYDPPGDAFRLWTEGRTGFPLVDAGMRQLRGMGWMHNRVRMVAASFLVKDLHVAWQYGARHFLRWLVDGDLASNAHGWQWVAGSGTDPVPYVRVFNPTTQGQKLDPDGAYVRRWVSELRDVDRRYIHEPVKDPRGLPGEYPAPMVDHAAERRDTLARFERLGR